MCNQYMDCYAISLVLAESMKERMAIYSNQNFRVEYSKRDPAKIHVNIFYKMSETSYQYRLEWDRNDNESESESDSWETRVDLVLPKITSYLKLGELLKCRLVSKKWVEHIDNLFSEQNPILRPYNQEMYTSTLHHRLTSSVMNEKCHFGKVISRYRFHRTHHLTGFTRRMVSQLKSNRNPFLCRYVSLGLAIENRDQDPKIIFRNVPEYWINLERFLRNWGKDIWYLQLSDDSVTNTASEFYLLLLKILKNLPNLRRLDIPSLRLDISRKLSEPLDQTILSNPLPPLAQLESILFPYSGKIPLKIQHALVTFYSRQLRNLRYALNSSNVDYPHVITKLNELTIFRPESSEKLSEQLELFTIPLAKLTLDLTQTPKILLWSVKHILSLLQDFPVKVAILKFSTTASLQETQLKKTIPIREQFKVETLQTLEMNHCVGTSYNFLWCLPALKHFHVDFNPFVDGDLRGNLVKLLVGTGSGTAMKDEDQQEVDIREMMEDGGDLYQSNIWDVVPTLEFMSFTKLHWCWWPKREVYKREVREWRKMMSREESRVTTKDISESGSGTSTRNTKTGRSPMNVKEFTQLLMKNQKADLKRWAESDDNLNGNQSQGSGSREIKGYGEQFEDEYDSIATTSSSMRGFNIRRLHSCSSLTSIK